MTRPTCPNCHSTNTWRSDLTDPDAKFQYSCGDCGTDFSPAEYQELIDLVFSQTIGEIDLNTDKPIMTALEKLHQTVLALGKEVDSLAGYTDRELQDLIDFIGILNSHIPTIEREACVRDMAQFGLIDQ